MPVTNWICNKCGITNEKIHFKCQICQQPKPIFWECVCKLKNPTAILRCSGCKRKRPPMFVGSVFMKSIDGKYTSISSFPAPSTINGETVAPSSGIGDVQVSSQTTTNSNLSSSISSNISSYDIFRKLSRPSRTVKKINYVDNEDKYRSSIEQCVQTNKQFIDKSFPPNIRSLYLVPAKANVNKTNRIYWLRPKEMRPPEIINPKSPVHLMPWCVIREPIASDITQGILGNCWLLSALAVLVEKPALLDRLLATQELSPYGIYRIRLYRDGKLTSMVIDDYFPCNSRRLLVYSCAKRKQLFVPLIEKAMARMYGCYESLVSGQTTQGLAALTGFPCRSIRTQVSLSPQNSNMRVCHSVLEEKTFNSDIIWALLLSYKTAGFLMGAACGCDKESTVPPEEYQEKGLLMLHAYSIISVVSIDRNRLLQLRNPWGSQVWNGDWSDQSPLWTDEMRLEYQPNKSSEGIFWMCFHDFQRYFEKVDVCKLRDNWYEERYEGYFPSSCVDVRYMSVFQVQIDEASTECEFTLYQESRRAINLYKKPLMPICAAVFQLKDKERQRNISTGDLVDFSGYKLREFVGCDVLLDKGIYLLTIYGFNHWNNRSIDSTKTGQNLRPRFVLSLHSSRFVTINCFCASPTLMGDTLIELTLSKGREKMHTEDVYSYYLHENWAGIVVVLENRNSERYLEAIFDATESTNLFSTRGALITQDTLPPMTRQLINILSHCDPSNPYYLSYQMSYRVSTETASSHTPEIGHLIPIHSPRPINTNPTSGVATVGNNETTTTTTTTTTTGN